MQGAVRIAAGAYPCGGFALAGEAEAADGRKGFRIGVFHLSMFMNRSRTPPQLGVKKREDGRLVLRTS